MEELPELPLLAGQRPSSLNASGLIADGRRTTLSRHTHRVEAAIQIDLSDHRN